MGILSRAAIILGGTLAAVAAHGAAQAGGDAARPKDGRIAYVQSALHWANYQTADLRKDCPDGLNAYGPRETFKALYPNGGSVEGTELAREALKYFPEDKKAEFPYILRKGPIALGLNLDGKVGPHDFVSPTGEKGIKNNLFKVLGCSGQYRQPTGQMQLFANVNASRNFDNRMIIEISGVDSLKDDDSVEVTIYRGRDPLLRDGTGEKYLPGGTQRIDTRYGQSFIQHLHGTIHDGVLTTEPLKEGVWPWSINNGSPVNLLIRDMRFRMVLTADTAEGLIGGYTDVESFHHWVNGWSTHHLSYGQLDPHETYWAVRENADAYPDADGRNTAISSALSLEMKRVYLLHPDEPLLDKRNQLRTASAH